MAKKHSDKKPLGKKPLTNAEKKVTVHSRKRHFDGFLKLDEAEVSYDRYDGGRTKHQTFLMLERGDAAAAFVHNEQRDTIILIEQFRFPTYDKGPGWLVETVAGGINKGETPEDCIKREILEEIGYEANKLILIDEFYVSPGGSSERIFLYYATVNNKGLIDPDASGCEDEKEDIRRIEIPVDEFFVSLDRGDYNDAKTIIAGHWYRSKRALWR